MSTKEDECPECNARSGHKPFCSSRTGKEPVADTRQKNKQNFAKRPDDGRKRK